MTGCRAAAGLERDGGYTAYARVTHRNAAPVSAGAFGCARRTGGVTMFCAMAKR